MRLFHSIFLGAIFFMSICISGCGGTQYVPPGQGAGTYNFSAPDLIIIADELTSSMIRRFEYTDKPIPVRVDIIKNKTSEYIDTKSVTDTIITKVINSGKFRFTVDYAELDAHDQRIYQEIMRSIGSNDRQEYLADELAPEYRIYGELTSLQNMTSGTRDILYKFTLKMVDMKGSNKGMIVWADEARLRKVTHRPLFGW